MTALRAQTRKSGLELDAPRNGRAADAYEVACTALWLADRDWSESQPKAQRFSYARHATVLHMISGRLHRIAERNCNFSYACPDCGGEGKAGGQFKGDDCRACAGRGSTTGRTEDRLEQQARDIAEHYRCRAYFQGDPRGCSLYLIPEEMIPGEKAATTGGYVDAREWISANYNRGHAVVRLGK